MMKFDTLSGSEYDIYLAAPLFNDMEKVRNQRINTMLEDKGFSVYLPQVDSGEVFAGTSREEIFLKDVDGLRKSYMVVALIDGAHIDEGTCWELGWSYANGYPIVMYSTDARSFMDGHQNVMIEYCGDTVTQYSELLKLAERRIASGGSN